MKYAGFILLLAGIFQCSAFSGAHAGVLDCWTTNQVSTNTYGLDYVVYGSGRYVAYGEYSDYGGIYTSADGFHWIMSNDGQTSGLSWSVSLVYAGGRFFALGGFGASAISTNGIDWNGYSFGGAANGAAYGEEKNIVGKYIVIGTDASSGNSKLFISTNATSWTAVQDSTVNGIRMTDIAYGDGGFVGIGPGYVFVSDMPLNGFLSWYKYGMPGGRFISFCNGIFVVPFGAGTNLLSYDGISWTAKNTGITNELGKVNYANGLFMARAGNYLATSTDGTNWFQYPQPLPPATAQGHYGLNIATDGKRLVTVGGKAAGSLISYDGFVYTSDVLAGVQMTNTPATGIELSGLVGRSYQIQSADTLTGNSDNWITNATLQLTNTPYVWTDDAATNSQRFYRGVLLS